MPEQSTSPQVQKHQPYIFTFLLDEGLCVRQHSPELTAVIGMGETLIEDSNVCPSLFSLIPQLQPYKNAILHNCVVEKRPFLAQNISLTPQFVVDVHIEPAPNQPDHLLGVLIRQETAVSPHPQLSTLEKQNRTLQLLNRASQALTATLETREVLEKLLQVAIEIIHAEGSSVWLWDEESPEQLVCRAAFHQVRTPPILNNKLRKGQGIAGWAAETGQSAIVNSVSDDPRFYPEIDRRNEFSTRSLLAIPLRLREKTLGVLEVVNKITGNFTEEDLSVAETLAASAAIAIDNARLVEALQAQTRDLQNQNDELDAFAHTVAHDLQNPLSLITGFANILEQDLANLEAEEVERILQFISRNVQKMSNIIQELLLLSSVRKMDVELKPLEMMGLVSSALARLQPLIDEHGAEVSFPDSWPVALGHAPWVEEVWENYISNAIKYGGRPPIVELGGEDLPDGRVLFWVKDNGEGVSPELQKTLFTPFTRLSEIRVTGYGLGLSIVHRIIEKLGGNVAVESEPGKGSKFCFILPGVAEEGRPD
ncbi:MAG: GAF domain-containing protein [Chloroflexi bacterium]|nr:MAG: GAF domain-containing protein [Chloroflexota bacterium]